jgi:subtilisin family serine protease
MWLLDGARMPLTTCFVSSSHPLAGAGIGIRINDDGVDALHLEFSSKFIEASSCSLYLPVVSDAKHSHGTTCASLAAGNGNNGLCSLGIAPNASISACRIILTETNDELAAEEADSSYLYAKMDNMHVSSNSYGVRSCNAAASSSTQGTRVIRRLQQECPFTATNITGASPCSDAACSAVDWSNPSPSDACEASISVHCQLFFESDVAACTSFLDLFVTCVFNSLSLDEQLALSKGVTEGRNGKGIVYVFAAGDEFDLGADVNFAGWQSSRYAIVVGAIDKGGKHSSYSTSGASLFISAPGGDSEYYFNNAVALAGGTCTDGGAGTSFAAPVVSGVVALVLEVNPDLTWRDVQGVLANSATMIQPTDPSWTTNSAGLRHSNLFGFGIVNASAAVALSRSWKLLSPEIQILADSGQVNISIPDFPRGPVKSTITVNATDTFKVESVVTYLDLYSSSRGELRIVLKSPSGTACALSPGQRPENSQYSERWKLTSVRFRDEAAKGNWTLSIADQSFGDVSSCINTLDWSVNVTFTSLNGRETAVLDCLSFQRAELCINGTEGPKLFTYFPDAVGLSDYIFANEDGLTPADACCACGGGVPATSLRDQLRSWRLVVFGNDPGLGHAPTSASAPTSSSMQAASPTANDPVPMARSPSLAPKNPTEPPLHSPMDSSPPIAGIAGGLVGGVFVAAIIAGFFFFWKKSTSRNHQKPPTFRTDMHDSENNTDASAPQASKSVPSRIQPEPIGDPLISTAAQPFITPMISLTTPATSPDPYIVQYKDQTQSVAGPSQSAPVMATAVPIEEVIPMAVAIDLMSEPPGRRMDDNVSVSNRGTVSQTSESNDVFDVRSTAIEI